MSEVLIPTVELEKVDVMFVKVEQQAGLDKDTAVALRGEFSGFYDEVLSLRKQTAMVTDRENPIHQKLAREIRLGLKNVRCEVDRVRKTLKEDSLKRGRAIDGFANVLKYLCEPLEEQLAAVEEYAARKEAARVAALVAERSALLVTAECDTAAYNLGVMTEATFTALLEGARQRQAEKIEALRKAEAERIEVARQAAIEKERILAENKRLTEEKKLAEAKAKREREIAAENLKKTQEKARREREAAEEVARKERALAEAKIASEREAREKAEREALEAKRKEQARVDAEKAAAAAKAKAERQAEMKAARAPDKEKLKTMVDAMMNRPLPAITLNTEEGNRVFREFWTKMDEVMTWFADEIEKL